MRLLLPLLLLCACAGSLVDHNGIALVGPDAGTPECIASCTTSVPGATPYCDGNTCTYRCPDGQFKVGGGCNGDATEISAGTGHTCAVVAGEARCWGANDKGQLGREGFSSFVPVAPGVSGTVVSHIAAGAAHTCAVVDGSVWCWGDNTLGQLGNGVTGASTGGAVPHSIAGISGALLIAAGGSHTCAATASKTYCWGNDDHGQIGDSSTGTPRPDPVEIVQAAGALALAAGDAHTCAVVGSSPGVICWGANDAGQTGNGAFSSPVSTPPASPILTGVGFLASGANHACGVAGDALSCWGKNDAGQIDGSGQNQDKPRGVLSGIVAVAAGLGHTCALTNNQTLRCRGLNDQQQLGGTGGGQNEVSVSLSAVQRVAAGSKHTCAVANGQTLCWGLNDRGQLGADPASIASTATPTGIPGL